MMKCQKNKIASNHSNKKHKIMNSHNKVIMKSRKQSLRTKERKQKKEINKNNKKLENNLKLTKINNHSRKQRICKFKKINKDLLKNKTNLMQYFCMNHSSHLLPTYLTITQSPDNKSIQMLRKPNCYLLNISLINSKLKTPQKNMNKTFQKMLKNRSKISNLTHLVSMILKSSNTNLHKRQLRKLEKLKTNNPSIMRKKLLLLKLYKKIVNNKWISLLQNKSVNNPSNNNS